MAYREGKKYCLEEQTTAVKLRSFHSHGVYCVTIREKVLLSGEKKKSFVFLNDYITILKEDLLSRIV